VIVQILIAFYFSFKALHMNRSNLWSAAVLAIAGLLGWLAAGMVDPHPLKAAQLPADEKSPNKVTIDIAPAKLGAADREELRKSEIVRQAAE
jgi:hypothetical protein